MREAGVRWSAKGSQGQWPVGLTVCAYECFCSHREHGGAGIGKVCRNCPPPGSRQIVVGTLSDFWKVKQKSIDWCEVLLPAARTEEERIKGNSRFWLQKLWQRENSSEVSWVSWEGNGVQIFLPVGEKRHVVHLGFITVCWGACVPEGGEQRSKGNKDVRAWKLFTKC